MCFSCSHGAAVLWLQHHPGSEVRGRGLLQSGGHHLHPLTQRLQTPLLHQDGEQWVKPPQTITVHSNVMFCSPSFSLNLVSHCLCVWKIIKLWWSHPGVLLDIGIIFNHTSMLMFFVRWCEYFISPCTEGSYITLLWCALLSKLQVTHCLTWSQTEEVDVVAAEQWRSDEWTMQAWTIQLFLCLTFYLVQSWWKGLKRHLCFEKRHAKTQTDTTTSDSMIVRILCQCLGCNLWPVRLLICMWPRQTQI